jgi:glutamyl-tRNA reductase
VRHDRERGWAELTVGTGIVTGVSVSHADATVEEIEAACADSEREAVEALLAIEGVEEAFCIQTCHRSEKYVVTEDLEAGAQALAAAVEGVPESVLSITGHEESLEHLLRVAAGLESMVLGEDQILGQVRQAFAEARAVGAIGPVLDEAVTKALHIGERARTETAINEGIVSLGSAAARLVAREDLPESATALVIGAGETGTLAADALAEEVDRLLVANRTPARAEALCDRLAIEASALSLADLPDALAAVDVVVSATASPEPLVDADSLQGAGETLIIDLARPRDVSLAVDDLPGVSRCDLGTVEAVIDDTRDRRRAAATAVEAMVESEFERLLEQYKRKRADDVIATMYESAERTKARELNTAFSKLDDLDDDQREVISAMADSLVGQLLAAPTKSLRDAAAEDDWTTINTALQLFDPEFGSRPPESLDSARPGDLPEELRRSMPTAVLEQLGE